MKRFLLPLLAAIALPTAVNANWLSGDIVETNAVGEKYIVKKTTIDAFEVFRVKDLNTFPTSMDPLIKQIQGYVKRWEGKFANCLESSKWGKSFCNTLNGICICFCFSRDTHKHRDCREFY